MKITAPDLQAMGIIDDIIPEVKGGAHHDLKQQAEFVKETIVKSMKTLTALSKEQLIQQRYEKFAKMGSFSS